MDRSSEYQGDKYDFAAPDSSSSNYKHWDLSTNAPVDEVTPDFAIGGDHLVDRSHVRLCFCMLFQQMSVLDKLHAALAEEKRMEGLRAQAEAAVRQSLSPLAVFDSTFCNNCIHKLTVRARLIALNDVAPETKA